MSSSIFLLFLCFSINFVNSESKFDKEIANITNLDKSFLEIAKGICDSSSKLKIQTCDTYAVVLQKLEERNSTVTSHNVSETLQNEAIPKTIEFCQQVNQTIYSSEFDQELRQHLFKMINPAVCGHICVELNEDDDLHVRPLCRFILFGMKQLALVKPVPAAAHIEIPEKIQVEEIHTKKEPVAAVVPVNLSEVNNEQGQAPSQPQIVSTAAPVSIQKVSQTEVKTITLNEGAPETSKKVEDSATVTKESKPVPSNLVTSPQQQSVEVPKPQENNTTPKTVKSVVETEAKPSVSTSTATISKEKPKEEKPVEEPKSENEKVPDKLVTPDSKTVNPFIAQSDPENQFENPDVVENFDDDDYPDQKSENDDNNIYEDTNIQKIPQTSRQDPLPEADDGPQKQEIVRDIFVDESENSNFFTYFTALGLLVILAYILYHNRSKLIAMLLEGRRHGGSRGGRRKHSHVYKKLALDCNLEEAITSNKGISKTTDVIY